MPKAVVTRIFLDGPGSLGADGFYHVGDAFRLFVVGSMAIDMNNPVANQINKAYLAEQITQALNLVPALGTNDVEII